jgi:two-component system, OmpR family, sensor histidine kinase KdpD
MPDTHLENRESWLALAKSSLTDALYAAKPLDSRMALVVLGLMGGSSETGPGVGRRRPFARARVVANALRARWHEPRDDARLRIQRAPLFGLEQRPAAAMTPGGLLSAFFLVMLAAGVGELSRPFMIAGSLSLPFLIAILLTAIAYGLVPSLFACVLSVLAFDFLFLPPLYSFAVSEPDDVMRLAVFALAALIVSNLAAYARHEAVAASERASIAEDLYALSRELTGAVTIKDVLTSSLPRLQSMLRAPVLIALPGIDGYVLHPSSVATDDPENERPSAASVPGTELAFINSLLRRHRTADIDPHAAIAARWMLMPMRTGRGEVGVMAVASEALDQLQVPRTDALFGTLADLLAHAVDRINLVDDLNRASRAAEREALHAALLASLSHDLRTPLTSVLGAAESLARENGSNNEAHATLARTIQDEARRLDRYIGNLLDMTRIDTGLTDTTTSRMDLTEVISVALDRCAKSLSHHRLVVDLQDDLPLLAGDEILLEHVLFNLLDNAAKYSPAGSSVALTAGRDTDHVRVEIIDEGSGIQAADLDHIFEKFYRGEHQGARLPGIGLGLSICRGYIEAMAGAISVRNRTDRTGAIFSILLPIPHDDEVLESDA